MAVGENEYWIKALDATRTAIHKDGEEGANQKVFVQEGDADCNCPGAIYHRTQCKHMKIRIAWRALGQPLGYFTVPKNGDPIFHATEVSE